MRGKGRAVGGLEKAAPTDGAHRRIDSFRPGFADLGLAAGPEDGIMPDPHETDRSSHDASRTVHRPLEAARV